MSTGAEVAAKGRLPPPMIFSNFYRRLARLAGSCLTGFVLILAPTALQGQSSGSPFPWTPTPRTVSGGESDGTVSRYWAPGMSSGFFTFSYDFYSIPDSAIISFGGQQIFSTGGYVSGGQTVSLAFGPSAPGTTPLLNVLVNPSGALPGTAWTFTLTPSARPILSGITISGPSVLNQGETGVYKAIASYTNGSTRVVEATWTPGAGLRLAAGAQHASILAVPGAAEVRSTLAVSYVEDGVTKKASIALVTKPAQPTNNPDKEKKTDPNRGGSEGLVGGAVNTATGAENFYRALLSLHGTRTVEFGLNYSSTFSSVSSPVGNGWSHAYGIRISESGDNVTVLWSSNRTHVFTLVRASTGSYYVCPDPDAALDVLAKTADGGFTLTKADQTLYSFRPGGILFEIRGPDGQKLSVTSDSSGTITALSDPVSGARLSFTYTSGKLVRVEDQAGRAVVLGYTGELLTSITDPDGRVTAYGYNPANKLVTVTAPDGTVIYRNVYDPAGRVIEQYDGIAGNPPTRFAYDTSRPGTLTTKVTDRLKGLTTYVYDANSRLVSQRDPLGRTVSWTYNQAGQPLTVRDPLGRVTSYEYDARGNPLRVRGPGGELTSSVFDARNNLVRLTNPSGFTTTYEYESGNRLVAWTDANGSTTRRTYDANGLLTSEILPSGATTTFGYTAGRLTRITDALGATTTMAYDPAGRLVSTTFAGGRTTSSTLSPAGLLLTQTDGTGAVTRFSYNNRGLLTQTRDPLGGVTTAAYDAAGRLVRTTDALGGSTTCTYDAEGRLTSSTDPRGAVTSYTYDSAGRVLTRKGPLGGVTTFAYDAAGNVVKVTDPTGAATTTAYSPSGLPVSVQDPLGRIVTTQYDPMRHPVRLADPLGRAVTMTYDPAGRLLSTTSALGFTTANRYDADGRRTALVEPSAASHTFAFDAAGREIAATDPLGRTARYSHNADGLPTTVVSPSGRTTSFQYDNARRLVRQTDASGVVSLTYDAKGRRVTTTEGSTSLTRLYDALDRLIRFTDANGNTVRYEYDAAGNMTKVVYPDGRAVTYAYDLGGRLTSVTDWAGRVTTYTYDAAGRITRTVRPNGTVQTRTYDKAGQLIAQSELRAGGVVSFSFALAYDKSGQISSMVRTPAVAATVPDLAVMTYNAGHQMTQFSGQPVAYDADGNMTSGPLGSTAATFTYDARHRLTAAGPSASHTYDAEDRRVQSIRGGVATTYVNNPAPRLWQTLEIRTAGSPVTYAVYGDGLLYTETGGVATYHHFDPRGNTVLATNQTGAGVYVANYDAYGKRRDLSGTPPSPFLFCGKFGVMTEPDGLLYCRARYYHPQLRRFLNPDPLGQLGGLNLYTYAGNNPVLGMDPSGEVANLVTGGAGALVGGAAGGLIAWWRGENVLAGMAGGAAGGFVVGTGAAFVAPAGAALTKVVIGKLALVGLAGGVAQDAVQQGVEIGQGDRKEYSVKQTVINGVVNAVGTPLLAGAGTAISKTANTYINKSLGTGAEIVDNLIKSGAPAEAIERVTETYLNNLLTVEARAIFLQNLLDGNRNVLTPYMSNYISAKLNDITEPDAPAGSEKGSPLRPRGPGQPIPVNPPNIPVAGQSLVLN